MTDEDADAAVDALFARVAPSEAAPAADLPDGLTVLPPAAGALPDLPSVPEGYFDGVVEAQAKLVRTRNPDASRAERLEEIVDKGLDTIDEILSFEIDPLMGDPLKLLSIKQAAAQAALNLAVKIDENHFRKRNGDTLTSILEKITAAERAQTVH